MTFRKLFQALFGMMLTFAIQLPAQQASQPASEAGKKPAAKAPMSAQEFAKRKQALMLSKNVSKWPLKNTLGKPGQYTVDLTVSECTYLGGSVVYWAGCAGSGKPALKCVAPNGHELCVDQII